MTVATSFGVLNYSGLLFNRNNVRTPLVNALSRKTTNHVEFTVSSEYAQGTPSIPNISEMTIGHSITIKSIYNGLDSSIKEMKELINEK